MSQTSLPLAGRNAVIFAATGEISQAVAASLGRLGARLFLSARNEGRLELAAKRLEKALGRTVAADIVDAADTASVEGYLRKIERLIPRFDITFNGIGLSPVDAGYGLPSTELKFDQFTGTLRAIAGSQFLTSSLVARRMTTDGGVIILITSSLSRHSIPHMAGITAASDAVEGLARVLTAEYAPRGIRVVCARLDSIGETRTIQLTMAANAVTAGIPVAEYAERIRKLQVSGRPLTLENAGQAIAFLATEAASAFTGRVVDIGYP
ncbi:MAG: SDR family oxidoreductase [Deltaproteobacteria bacterium]|nr:SDR family oxidoreductase [Deltaproteobacteria bacterium]